MVSVADVMQEQYDQKTGKRNKENLRRTVNVLAVATTLMKYAYSFQQKFVQCYLALSQTEEGT